MTCTVNSHLIFFFCVEAKKKKKQNFKLSKRQSWSPYPQCPNSCTAFYALSHSLCPTQGSPPSCSASFLTTHGSLFYYLDSQSDICVPYKSPVTHPGSLSCVCRACPVPSCAALHKDSWIVWFDAMLKWLTLAASSWTTSLTVTSCVSSTHWLSMHTPSFCRYLVTPTSSPGYVITLEFQRPSAG